MITRDDVDKTSTGEKHTRTGDRQRDRANGHASGRAAEFPKTVSQAALAKAQNTIFQYLLDIVKTWPSDDVLDEFKSLFIYCGNQHDDAISESELIAVMRTIAAANQEKEFKNTLKRSCYILINNWDITRNHEAIGGLIQLFSDPGIKSPLKRPLFKRLRRWLQNFIASDDFKELTLFAARYDDFEKLHWSQRYTSYLLVSQYANLKNSDEQREAARALSRKLKERFKVDLALYTAFSESLAAEHSGDRVKNPTVLGEDSLEIIKRILACRGPFSYEHLANIFRKQSLGIGYERFKRSLETYLLCPLPDGARSKSLERQINKKLSELYQSHSNKPVDEALLLRTCNRMIKWFTIEEHGIPSDVFVCAIAEGNALTIVILLLKLLLICRNTRTHLESCIADLVRYYEDYPEEDCRAVIDFFEVFNVTMTVYGEDIRYSLISKDGSSPAKVSLEACRIFSQVKPSLKAEDSLEGDRDPAQMMDHFVNEFIESEDGSP
ncbi:MAG: hypothetical protein ACFB4J_20095 [Elainellaceae cyanobacterium]